ncbi:MAG: hypothetical protein U0869_17625 [Chloroflexota bacterium]
MKRLALTVAALATLLFAGPVSANHEVWRATFDRGDAPIYGVVTVALNATHTEGTLSYNLDKMKDGDASIYLHGGTCAKDSGDGIVLRWVTGRDFPNGDWNGRVDLPDGSAKLFKHDSMYHNGVHVTIKNEGRFECLNMERLPA